MALFDFKSNNHFVASSDGANLLIYELTNPTVHLPSIKKTHWKKVATIQTSHGEDDMSYNGLMFFDGHGRIEEEEELTMLAQHLKDLHLLVSPEGYCFQEVSDLGVYSDYGIDYLRLNDLFSWPRYGVELATTNVWSRSELKYHLPRHKQHSKPAVHGGLISKEKYEELKRSVKEKNDELEKLKEKLKECENKSWAILPSTKFIPWSLDPKDKHLTRRQPCPQEKFDLSSQPFGHPWNANLPEFEDNAYFSSNNGIRLVDDDEMNTSTWPSPPTFHILVVRDNTAVRDLDKNDWWYVKTTNPEGGLTMLVYYDGNRSRISVGSFGDHVIVPFPCSKGVKLMTYTYRLCLFDMFPYGMRFGFMYRPLC